MRWVFSHSWNADSDSGDVILAGIIENKLVLPSNRRTVAALKMNVWSENIHQYITMTHPDLSVVGSRWKTWTVSVLLEHARYAESILNAREWIIAQLHTFQLYY